MNDISRNFLLRNRKKIAKFLMRTFTCCSTFPYDMDEPGERCTVVFALIVTEPACNCVCGGGGEGGVAAPPFPIPLAGPVKIYAKTTVNCAPGSSVFFGNGSGYVLVLLVWGHGRRSYKDTKL